MPDDLVPYTDAPIVPGMTADDHAAELRERAAGLGESTVRAYRSVIRDFGAFCAARGAESYPAHPSVLAAYVRHLAHGGRKPATVRKHVSAINSIHRRTGAAPPVDDRVRRAILTVERAVGIAVDQRAALEPSAMLDLLRSITPMRHRRGKRTEESHRLQLLLDRAVLAVGYGGGFRSAELVGIDAAHVTEEPARLVIYLPRSKTDQRGAGRYVSVRAWPGVDVCPVASLRAWREASGALDGPIFRSVLASGDLGPRLHRAAVWRAIKRCAERAGLDSDDLGAHSLRASHITARLAAGDSYEAVAEQVGHRSTDTTRRYDRRIVHDHDDVGAMLAGTED